MTVDHPRPTQESTNDQTCKTGRSFEQITFERDVEMFVDLYEKKVRNQRRIQKGETL